MRTVQRLIEELQKFPPDAEVAAYEREDTGIVIEGHGFIPCRTYGMDDGETEFVSPKEPA